MLSLKLMIKSSSILTLKAQQSMAIHVIVTGDLVNSRTTNSQIWLPVLEDTLNNCSTSYDIYRGDSFQAELDCSSFLETLFYIKARIKTIEQLDVRLGVGIGTIESRDSHLKNSTGQAFLYSGEAFDSLKKELFVVKSSDTAWDDLTNSSLALAFELANKWTNNMAETVAASIQYPSYSQQDLAKILQRKHQSQVSTELGKASWIKIKRAIDYCQQELKTC